MYHSEFGRRVRAASNQASSSGSSSAPSRLDALVTGPDAFAGLGVAGSSAGIGTVGGSGGGSGEMGSGSGSGSGGGGSSSAPNTPSKRKAAGYGDR